RRRSGVSWRGLLQQRVIDGSEFLPPDAFVDDADILLANDAASVDEECLGRAVYAEVEPQDAGGIFDVQPVRVVQRAQPALRRVAVVLVVDAVDDHALLGQLIQYGVLLPARRTPGRPDIHQRRPALDVVARQRA